MTQALLLSYGAASGGPAIAFDPANTNSSLSLSGSNTIATRPSGGPSAAPARATVSKSAGKWYVEFLVTAVNGSNIAIGLANSSFNTAGTSFLGETANAWAYWSTNSRYFNNVATGGYATYTVNDVIGLAWDAGAGNLWWAKNNTWQGGGDPAAGTVPGYTSVTGTLFPAIDLYNLANTVEIRSSSGYSYSPPSGFSAWQ